jgi:hypothetical protein
MEFGSDFGGKGDFAVKGAPKPGDKVFCPNCYKKCTAEWAARCYGICKPRRTACHDYCGTGLFGEKIPPGKDVVPSGGSSSSKVGAGK